MYFRFMGSAQTIIKGLRKRRTDKDIRIKIDVSVCQISTLRPNTVAMKMLVKHCDGMTRLLGVPVRSEPNKCSHVVSHLFSQPHTGFKH